MSHGFIAVQGKSNVIRLESTSFEKASLARSLPNVLWALGAKALAPHGERPLTPTLPVAIDGLGCQIVTDAPLSQLITYFQRTQPARCPLHDESLCESLVGQEILSLERVQHLADKRLRKASHSELAAELGSRVLAARE